MRLSRLKFSLRTLMLTMLFAGSAVILWLHWEPWYVAVSLQTDALIKHVEFSPDDQRVVALSEMPMTEDFVSTRKNPTTVWSVDGRHLSTVSWAEPRLFTFVSFCNGSDQIKIVYGHESFRTAIFDCRTGENILGEDKRVNFVNFSNGSRCLVNSEEGAPYVYDLATHKRVCEFKQGDRTRQTAFSMDGRRAFTINAPETQLPDYAVLWNAENGKEICIYNDWRGYNPVFSPDSKRLLISNDDVRLFDSENGQTIAAFEGNLPAHPFSRDGQSFVVNGDGHAVLVSCANGKIISELPGVILNSTNAFSEDGKYLVLAHESLSQPHSGVKFFEHFVLWDLSNNTEKFSVYTPGRCSLGSFYWTAGALIHADALYTTFLWNYERGITFHCEARGLMSPDGKRLLTLDTSTIRQVEDGEIVCHLHSPGGYIEDAAWSGDSGSILTGSSDGIARLWRPRRPEAWWGILWLPEFWCTLIFAVALCWSILKERQSERV